VVVPADNIATGARQAAAECVYSVCEQGESLDTALATRGAALANSESSLFRALSYGGVRWYLAYKIYLNSRLKKPFKPKDRILYAILVTALYQLDDTRHAPHAVVNEAVALAKKFNRQWAAGLVNAVLRNYIRESGTLPLKDTTQWNRQAYPEWMVQQFHDAWPEQLDAILAASQARPPMTLRVNVRQTSPKAYLNTLAKQDMVATLCQDSPQGITLNHPIPVDQLPGFDSARVSVQDESAQLAVEFMDLLPGQNVLDACAAPGGKSLHILEFEPAIASLSVLDFPDRLPRLRENFERANITANILEGDILNAKEWSDGTRYDRILLDVPCTGTGVIRRHPDIKFRRQEENGLQFAGRQLELLHHAWRLLSPGGKLLYTTCSILPVENELCVAAFVHQTDNAVAIALPEKLGMKTVHGRQRLPGSHAGDGFFYALLKKNTLV
jgi:16S rRNA (cytosine967-C5)-methyltransferase